MNIDNRISVIAGRPGAGKTLWAAREAIDCLRDPNNRPMVFLFYDQCRHDIFNGRRELLKAAMKAGVHVHVLCQKFSQADRNDVDWLNKFCSPYIISKMRDPRPATAEEINEKFR